jgi:uncharacterized protein (AIM24 family)
MTIHGSFAQYEETEGQDPFTKQNSKMLKVFLQYGPIKARLGSMVAYQGEASFASASSGGASKWLKQKMTGEGAPLMDISGSGEVFLADLAQEIEIIYLQDDMISVNGTNLLAFSASIDVNIERVGGGGGMGSAMAGGFYNTILRGSGYVAVLTDGPPVAFDVSKGETFADPQAVVCWTSGVSMAVRSDVNLRTLIGKGSGETFQLGFSGSGHVLVQPSEGRAVGTGQQGGGKGGGGVLGALGG